MASNEEIKRATDISTKWLKERQAKHLSMVQDSIGTLQDGILDAMTDLSMTDGILDSARVNFSRAQTIHQKVVNLFSTKFNSKTKEIVDDFTNAHSQVLSNFETIGEYAQFTGADMTMFEALRDGYYSDYLAVGAQARDKITKAMYNHVIGQQSFSKLETSIRAALSGSNAKTATGRSMAQYSRLYARDMIMNYHGDVTLTKAGSLGMNYFKYTGTLSSRSRLFCRQRVGRVFSKKEIDSWNYKWAGRAGDAFHFRGGYNCRHHWQPVRPDWLSDEEQGRIDLLNKVDDKGKITPPTPKKKPVPPVKPVKPEKPVTPVAKTGKIKKPEKIGEGIIDSPPSIKSVNEKMTTIKNSKKYKALMKEVEDADIAITSSFKEEGDIFKKMMAEEKRLMDSGSLTKSEKLIEYQNQKKSMISTRADLELKKIEAKRQMRSMVSKEFTAYIKPPTTVKEIGWKAKGFSTRASNALKKDMKSLSSYLSPKTMKGVPNIGIEYQSGVRSFYRNSETKMVLGNITDTPTTFHEFGHHLEYNVPGLQKKAQTFLKTRAGSDPLTTIYGTEQGWRDGFISHYTGKYYKHGATEIVSMGFQHMIEDPVNFFEKDPGHFNFILEIMWGKS